MSAIENPTLETQLDGIMVLSELYKGGAFSKDIAMVVEYCGTKVDGVLFGFDKGLLVRELSEDGKLYADNTTAVIAYLTPKGKKVVEEMCSFTDKISSFTDKSINSLTSLPR